MAPKSHGHVLMRDRKEDAETQQRRCESRGKYWGDAPTSRRAPRIASSHQKPGDTCGTAWPSESPEGDNPVNTVIRSFWYISVVLSHPIAIIRYGRPKERYPPWQAFLLVHSPLAPSAQAHPPFHCSSNNQDTLLPRAFAFAVISEEQCSLSYMCGSPWPSIRLCSDDLLPPAGLLCLST